MGQADQNKKNTETAGNSTKEDRSVMMTHGDNFVNENKNQAATSTPHQVIDITDTAHQNKSLDVS